MPAINTGGFQVQNMPRVDFADPRLLTANLSGIIPAAQQGLGFYNGLQQIADEAQARPTRQQLLQIQLQDAQNRLGLAPLERDLRMAQISEAQQNAATPRLIAGDVMIEDGTKEYPAAFDEFGVRTGPSETVIGDLVEVQSGREIGPGGVVTPRTVRKTLKTAEQRQNEATKQAASIRASDALAGQRARGKEFESTALIQSYNDALEAGDDEVAALYKSRIDKLNAAPGLLAPGTAYNRRVEQLAADAGITLAAAQELAKTPAGAEALAQAAVANKAAARSPFGAPALSAEQKELIRGGGPPAAAPAPVAAPAPAFSEVVNTALGPAPGAPVAVRTKAERDALPPGTQYIGPDGQTYIKK